MTTSCTKCIFCEGDTSECRSQEHIVPQSLWPEDPEQLPPILPPGVVCDACNSRRLSTLDRALQETLGFLKVYVAPVTKKGKFPSFRVPNAIFERCPSGLVLYASEKRGEAFLPDGRKLRAPRVNERGLRNIQVEEAGGFFRLRFSLAHSFHRPVFVRALHKIALEFYAHYWGPHVVLDESFKPVRRFVLTGTPKRPALALAIKSMPLGREGHVLQVFPRKGMWQYIIRIKLCGLEFLVSLNEDLNDLVEIRRVQGDTYIVLGSLS